MPSRVIPRPRLVILPMSRHRLGLGFSIPSPDAHGTTYPIVNEVFPGSPADLSGIKENDRILCVNNIIGDAQEMAKELRRKPDSTGGEANPKDTKAILVADENCYNYHTSHGMDITSQVFSYINRRNFGVS